MDKTYANAAAAVADMPDGASLAVIDVTDKGLVLAETAPGVSIETFRAATGAQFSVSPEFAEAGSSVL